MKPAEFGLVRAVTVDDVIAELQRGEGEARVVAGGQSLIPMMNFRLARPATLIDITGIAELRGIRRDDDGSVSIGATTTHAEVERSPLLKEALPLLPFAMRSVAHRAIRNRGTLGGSVAHADPAAEWPALCIAASAEIDVAGPTGRRCIAAADFFKGTFWTDLEEGEILTSVRFPAWGKQPLWHFAEVSRRRGDFAMAGIVAVAAAACGAAQAPAARLVLFGVEDVPRVLGTDLRQLAADGFRPDDCRSAVAAALQEIEPRGDLHASAEYRRGLARALLERGLRALGEQQADGDVDAG
ncbi:MAG: xanthine dehydrogenase family protein subunit M [Burkholderiaceae bacterium]